MGNVQFEKLKRQVSELTVDNFPGFVMEFFHAGRSDIQRTWFDFDNPKSKEIGEKIDWFIKNLTPDQREKIDNEIYDCDLSWSWRCAGNVACLTVGWTEVMLSGV